MLRIRKKPILITLLLLAVIAFTRFERPGALQNVEHIEVTKRRSRYTNPVYSTWKPKEQQSIEANCASYFGYFDRIGRPSLEEQAAFQHDGLLFKKTKWLREEGKLYRKETRRNHQPFDKHYELKLLEKFFEKSAAHSRLEEGFVADMAHMRAFGKCFLEDKHYASRETRLCDQVSPFLFPFLLGSLPRIDHNGKEPHPGSANSEDRACFIKQLLRKGHGDGIVIPILPSPSRSQQIVRAIRLIKVLRATNNTLPIEITFMDNKDVRKDLKLDINLAARRADMKLPESFQQFLALNNGDSLTLAEQNVRFVYLQRSIDSRFYKSSDPLMMSLAPLFSSFERAIVLSTQTIPLFQDLSHVLQDSDVEQFGVKFFKSRAIYEQKLTKYPPGYFETNELVNGMADVNNNDTEFFGLRRARNVYSKRVRHESYTKLLDTSMFVIDKLKALPGLLISAALHYYPVINSKYDFLAGNFEALWLGQELAGTLEYVPFNSHFAVSPGILTPPENVEVGIPSKELCSSSWAQLSDKDDINLLYVTTHQIENRVLPEFDNALKRKFLIKTNPSDPTDSTVDDSIHTNKLKKNPLRLESYLRPVAVDERQFNRDGFVELPWNRKGLFGSLDDYWCAYDIVGSTELPLRGLVIDINEDQQVWYNSLIEIWLLSSHQQSSSMGSYE